MKKVKVMSEQEELSGMLENEILFEFSNSKQKMEFATWLEKEGMDVFTRSKFNTLCPCIESFEPEEGSIQIGG